jgi:hypothetical protein
MLAQESPCSLDETQSIILKAIQKIGGLSEKKFVEIFLEKSEAICIILHCEN